MLKFLPISTSWLVHDEENNGDSDCDDEDDVEDNDGAYLVMMKDE